MDWKTETYAIRVDTDRERQDVLERLEKITGLVPTWKAIDVSHISHKYYSDGLGYLERGDDDGGECYISDKVLLYSAASFLEQTTHVGEPKMGKTLTWKTNEEAEKLVGAKVKISKEGQHRYGAYSNNPIDVTGVITETKCNLRVCVSWPNGMRNKYESGTLDLVEEKAMTPLEQLREAVTSGKIMTDEWSCPWRTCDECPLRDEDHEPDLCAILDKKSSIIGVTPAINIIKVVALEKINKAIAKTKEKSEKDKKIDEALLKSIAHWRTNTKEIQTQVNALWNIRMDGKSCALCQLNTSAAYDGTDCSRCILPKCGHTDSVWRQASNARNVAANSLHTCASKANGMLNLLLKTAKERNLKVD